MGQSQSLATEVEIQGPLATVRSAVGATCLLAVDAAKNIQFLDFPSYNQWSKRTIEPADSSQKPSELKAGDRINVNLKGMASSPIVVVGLTDTHT